MLDITFIRDNKDIVQKSIKDRGAEEVDLNLLLKLYDERKELLQKLNNLNEQRNAVAKERNIEEGRRIKDEIKNLEGVFKDTEKSFMKLMLAIPNVPSPDTPIGKDETENKVIRQVGERPKLTFTPKEHWELGKELDIIDNETAADVSGARFTYLKGDIVLLQFALIQYVFSILTNADKLSSIAQSAGLDIFVTPFVPVIPPVMMKSAVMNRMARLHPLDERYYLEKDDLVLVGSAEHTLGPMHMDHVFEEKDLPLRYVGYSSAFRREAGTYGKDTKGILRLHQFDKLEMETFVLPEHSIREQDFIVAIQEHLVQSLKLPYQVVAICTGDMGGPDQRQIDIEIWMPGQNTYRETHTSDLIGGYQSRRLNTRVRRGEGKPEHVHMNDATAFAAGRMLIAIIENYQQKDGSIVVPEVLRSYSGIERITKQ